MSNHGHKIKYDFYSSVRSALDGKIETRSIDMVCKTLCDVYGGQFVYINKSYARSMSVRSRNERIKERRFNNNLSTSEIAESFGITARQVRRILRT